MHLDISARRKYSGRFRINWCLLIVWTPPFPLALDNLNLHVKCCHFVNFELARWVLIQNLQYCIYTQPVNLKSIKWQKYPIYLWNILIKIGLCFKKNFQDPPRYKKRCYSPFLFDGWPDSGTVHSDTRKGVSNDRHWCFHQSRITSTNRRRLCRRPKGQEIGTSQCY